MNKEYKISVALSTYNGKKYIIEQLRSIVEQTCQPNEIIISDDHSEDDTVNIVDAYVKQKGLQKLVHIIQNDSQSGVIKNFERATNHCTGDIIFYCDQDDVWEKDKIYIMIHCFQDNDVAAVFCNAMITDENLKSHGLTQWGKIGFLPSTNVNGQCIYGKGELIPELLRHNVMTGMCMAMRRELITFVGIPQGTLHDSWLAWISTINGKIVAIDIPLVQYRQHPNNVMGAGSKISKKKLKEYKKLRAQRLIWLSNRFASIYSIIRNLKTLEKYYCRIEDAIDFNYERGRILEYQKKRYVIKLLKMYAKGLYKKYTEDNLISLFKDIFAVMQ